MKIGAPTRWNKWTAEGKLKASLTPTRIFTQISENNRFYTRALTLWAELRKTAKNINIPEVVPEPDKETPKKGRKRKQKEPGPTQHRAVDVALLSQKKRRALR